MQTNQTYALLIAGDEQRFLEGVTKFRKFLVDDLFFNPENIQVVLGSEGANHICVQTELFFKNAKRNGDSHNAVILYYGHGEVGKLFPREGVPYEEWGRSIDSDFNFVFVNDSCYSGSSIPVFHKLGLLPDKGLVIASAGNHELSYGDKFLNTLIQLYSRGMIPRIRRLGSKQKKVYKIKSTVDPRISNTRDSYVDHDGTIIIRNLGDYKDIVVDRTEREIVRVIGNVQHPVRNGKGLEHLLIKK